MGYLSSAHRTNLTVQNGTRTIQPSVGKSSSPALSGSSRLTLVGNQQARARLWWAFFIYAPLSRRDL